MVKPIIWTVIAAVIILFTIFFANVDLYWIALICFAVACVFFQWLAYFKKKNSK